MLLQWSKFTGTRKDQLIMTEKSVQGLTCELRKTIFSRLTIINAALFFFHSA